MIPSSKSLNLKVVSGTPDIWSGVTTHHVSAYNQSATTDWLHLYQQQSKVDLYQMLGNTQNCLDIIKPWMSNFKKDNAFWKPNAAESLQLHADFKKNNN